jgi:transcription elongation factor GreA-like protein
VRSDAEKPCIRRQRVCTKFEGNSGGKIRGKNLVKIFEKIRGKNLVKIFEKIRGKILVKNFEKIRGKILVKIFEKIRGKNLVKIFEKIRGKILVEKNPDRGNAKKITAKNPTKSQPFNRSIFLASCMLRE